MSSKDRKFSNKRWRRIAWQVIIAIGATLILWQAVSTLLAVLNLGKG